MEINRLRSDELTWELTIRGCNVGSTVEQKRSQLRDAWQQGIADDPNVQLDSLVELNVCSAKLDEIIGLIQEFDNENQVNEFKRINSRLLHIQGRLNRVTPTNRDLIRKKDNLTFVLSGALDALNDANLIATLSQPNTSRAQAGCNPVNNSHSVLVNTSHSIQSIIDQPISESLISPNHSILSPREPPVGQLIDLEPNNVHSSQIVTSPANIIPPPANFTISNDNLRSNIQAFEMSRLAQDTHNRSCRQLADSLNQLALQSIRPQSSLSFPRQPLPNQENFVNSIRRVSFTPNVTDRAQEGPIIESVYSNPPVNFANWNSTTNNNIGNSVLVNDSEMCSSGLRVNGSSNNDPVCTNHNIQTGNRYCAYQSCVPLYKWEVFYDGSGSVLSFIEEVEQLADSRRLSREQVFGSVYEILRGDARDWYLPRKETFLHWEDFKNKLKEAFLPLSYEDNLLEDIKRRTQGTDERLMLYITRMQNLFKRLTVNKQSEQQQVVIIRKNLLPNLQTALAFQETGTIEELLKKGREVEQIQWQAQQYCPPPTQARLIEEPHLAYRRANTSRQVPVRAIHTAQTERPILTRTPESASSSPRTQNNPVTCWNCKQPGHKRSRCPQPLRLACFKWVK